MARLECPQDTPVTEVERPDDAVAAAREAEPPSVVVTPPRSGSGVLNFQRRRPVPTLIALIEPWSFQFGFTVPKLPISSPRKTSPSTSLRRFSVGVSFFCVSTAEVSAAALTMMFRSGSYDAGE
jgi:hypothetical protein